MPSTKSAEKQLRKSERRRARNRRRVLALKRVLKEMESYLSLGEKEKAQALLAKLMQVADRAAAKGPFHKNKAARIKSKWTRKVNELGSEARV
ncbi:MAG: 30S ribosomal protein S20 [Candidatus Bipolaricaulia bacterium]